MDQSGRVEIFRIISNAGSVAAAKASSLLPLPLLLLLLLFAFQPCVLSAKCFDFAKKKVTFTLKAPFPFENSSDTLKKGVEENKKEWGAVRAVVQRPLKDVLTLLLDRFNIKNPKTTKLDITIIPSAHYLRYDQVVNKVKPVFFITIEWTEEWAYSLIDGTRDKPKHVIISYQKVAGEPRLKHQCGSIEIKAIDKNTTDGFFYEEVISDYWSGEKAVKMFLETVRLLREAEVKTTQ